MKTHLLVLICALLGAVWLMSCQPGTPESTPPPPVSPETIAYYGHGMLLDKNWKELQLDEKTISEIQDAMLTEVMAQSQPDEKKDAIEEAQDLLKSQQLDIHEAIYLKSALISAYLETAPAVLADRYGWRNSALLSFWWSHMPEIRQQLLELIRRLVLIRPSTGYMDSCRNEGVPVPPDWAETGTAWQRQGTLRDNILQPGAHAEVWTYSDPANRGACVALPRGSGAAGSPAGIICQSATTGKACFWDNVLRDEVDGIPGEQFVGWSGLTLVISNLKDGSNLNNACTNCHRGNNVYLISPDDPTWSRVLRGPLNGPSTGTFTSQVETSSDNRGGHPRYVPVSGQPGWDNPFSATTGFCTTCHEQPVVTQVSAMPPACAAPPTNPNTCYGTP